MAEDRIATPESGGVSADEPRPTPRLPNAWRRTFAALQSPNYSLWFRGQLVSVVGTWMQITAQGFLVYQLTKSTAYLGYVGFANGVPPMLLMLFGGVVADRVSRRRLLIMTQSTMMLLAFVLATLTFLQIVQPWHIVLLALALGTANAFDAPAAQAFVTEIVDRKDLTNAIALNSTLFNLATVIGPTVAGLTYAAFGAGWCFTLNGLSFIAVIVALLRMRLPQHSRVQRSGSAITQLQEGIRFVLASPVLRILIAIPAVAALLGTAYSTLLPAWAVDVLGGDAATNGLLQSARGVGSLLGALMIAALGHVLPRGRVLTVGTILYPLMLILFAAVHVLPLTMIVLVGVGLGGMIVFNMANTLVQSHVPNELRGRVMSIYSLTFFGGMPLSALWSGALANVFGAPWAITVGAIVLVALSALFAVMAPQIRKLT